MDDARVDVISRQGPGDDGSLDLEDMLTERIQRAADAVVIERFRLEAIDLVDVVLGGPLIHLVQRTALVGVQQQQEHELANLTVGEMIPTVHGADLVHDLHQLDPAADRQDQGKGPWQINDLHRLAIADGNPMSSHTDTVAENLDRV